MADAVKAVRYLLANNAGVTAVVTATQIMAGPLPQDTAMPAIEIRLISSVELQQVAAGSGFHQARVQVSVKAANYPQLRQVLALVRAALPRSRGTHNTVKVDSIIPDTEGPNMADAESGIYFGSHDFMVRTVD